MGWTMGLEPHCPETFAIPYFPTYPAYSPDRDHKQSIPVDPATRNVSRATTKNGVDDGTRTHDDRDHNPGLYQLSYAHH